jgi:hypothetical protein
MSVVFSHIYGFRLNESTLLDLFKDPGVVDELLNGTSSARSLTLTVGIVGYVVDFEHHCQKDKNTGERATIMGVQLDSCDLEYSGAMEIDSYVSPKTKDLLAKFVTMNPVLKDCVPKHYVYLDLNK